MNFRLRSSCAALLALAAATAGAHVTLEYPAAAASSYKASFKVGHGCGESATRQVVVDVPAGGVRPMTKAGWQLAVESANGEVARATWTAKSREDMLASGAGASGHVH